MAERTAQREADRPSLAEVLELNRTAKAEGWTRQERIDSVHALQGR